jgi:hypothetical protein
MGSSTCYRVGNESEKPCIGALVQPYPEAEVAYAATELGVFAETAELLGRTEGASSSGRPSAPSAGAAREEIVVRAEARAEVALAIAADVRDLRETDAAFSGRDAAIEPRISSLRDVEKRVLAVAVEAGSAEAARRLGQLHLRARTTTTAATSRRLSSPSSTPLRSATWSPRTSSGARTRRTFRRRTIRSGGWRVGAGVPRLRLMSPDASIPRTGMRRSMRFPLRRSLVKQACRNQVALHPALRWAAS